MRRLLFQGMPVLIGFITIQLLAFGRPEDRMVIPKIDGGIQFDGRPFEPVWNTITPLPVIMFQPVYGNAPSEITELRLCYTADYLYFSGRLYDKEPNRIQSKSKKRDDFEGNSDAVGLILDSFNDKENGLMFTTTPAGLRSDMTIFNDATGSMDHMPFNMDWNTFWDVETHMDEKGWYFEMRIPISSLRFQPSNDTTVMGLIVWRWIPHLNELHIFPSIDPKYGDWAMMKVSQAREVEFSDLQPQRPIYLTPYALAGWQETRELNHSESAYDYHHEPLYKLGGDFKYGITSNLTLDLTVNTDFAQVEADDQQVNLTRFSLFYPEKRQFFQERSSNFDFSMGGPNNLFYSRRIGLHEGQEVRIYGGARLVGRLGNWDLGFLDMQTAQLKEPSELDPQVDSLWLPSENFGVLRVRRQVINQNSYVGGIFTSRLGRDGSYNVAYGLDAIIRLFGDDYLSMKWAQTFETGARNNALSLAPARISLNWERRSEKGLAYDLSYSQSGTDFNPGIGFEARDNYIRIGDQIQWGWLPGESSRLYSHRIFMSGNRVSRIEDGTVESATIGPGWGFNTKNSSMGNFRVQHNIEDVNEYFELSDDVGIPVGRYTFWTSEVFVSTPMTRPAYIFVELNAGQFFDGNRYGISLMPNWNASSSLALKGSYEFNRLTFPGRNEQLNVHIGRLKILYMFSIKFSISAFIQYNSAVHNLVSNVRVRYNPREGNDLYIVYNEGRNTDLKREVPHLPGTPARTIMLKYTYTFGF
jgi:hypothetical protein